MAQAAPSLRGREPEDCHDPEVGGSDLPPATIELPPSFDQLIFKALWNIRHLSKNTQKTYSKHLRRLAREVDLNKPELVEAFIFNLDCKNKKRNNYFMIYSHYCSANEIDWS